MTSNLGTCFWRDSWLFGLPEGYISQAASPHAILDNFLERPEFPSGPPISQQNARCKLSGRVAPNPNATDLLEGSTNRTEQRKWGKPCRFFVGRLQVGDVDFVSCWRYTMDSGIVGLGCFQGFSGRDLSQIILNLVAHRGNQLKSTAFQFNKIIRYSKVQQISPAHIRVTQPFPIWVVTL